MVKHWLDMCDTLGFIASTIHTHTKAFDKSQKLRFWDQGEQVSRQKLGSFYQRDANVVLEHSLEVNVQLQCSSPTGDSCRNCSGSSNKKKPALRPGCF